MTSEPIAINGSSNIAAVSYDADSKTLTVDFLDGDSYEYANVPQSVAIGLAAAPSPGRYFYQHIRNLYAYEKV